jgi:hypothetical protein
MLVRTLIATVALVGLTMTGMVTTVAFAQSSGTQTMAPAKKPMMMKKEMHKGSAKMAKEGHKMDNIADKLNACEMQPTDQRQSCINSATRM